MLKVRSLFPRLWGSNPTEENDPTQDAAFAITSFQWLLWGFCDNFVVKLSRLRSRAELLVGTGLEDEACPTGASRSLAVLLKSGMPSIASRRSYFPIFIVCAPVTMISTSY